MRNMESLKAQILAECRVDHVGLWAIIRAVRDLLGPNAEADVRPATLQLLRDLLHADLIQAGLPNRNGPGFAAWQTSTDETIMAIDRDWRGLGRDPDIGEIVWFTGCTGSG